MPDTIPLVASLSQYRGEGPPVFKTTKPHHEFGQILNKHDSAHPPNADVPPSQKPPSQKPTSAANSPSRKTPWRGILVAGVLLIGLAAFFAKVRAGQTPTISRAEFEAARTKWADSKPGNYQITVQVKGMQPGIYEVGVENNIATSASFDGRDLKRQRTFGTWAVTGMFETLARDFETNDKENYLLLKGEFDPTYGFPKRYERIEMRTGAHDALQWEVTQFRVKD